GSTSTARCCWPATASMASPMKAAACSRLRWLCGANVADLLEGPGRFGGQRRLEFRQLLCKSGAAHEAEPPRCLRGVVDAIDRLEQRPAQAGVEIAIAREVARDDGRGVVDQRRAILAGERRPRADDEGVEAQLRRLLERSHMALGCVLDRQSAEEEFI